MNKQLCAKLLKDVAKELAKARPTRLYLCCIASELDVEPSVSRDVKRQIMIDVVAHGSCNSFGYRLRIAGSDYHAIYRHTEEGRNWLATYALFLAEYIETDV